MRRRAVAVTRWPSLGAKRAPAGRLHAGHHPRWRSAVREARPKLAEERIGVPALIALEELAGRPAAQRVDGAAPDVEDLARDPLRLVCCERDDERRHVRGIEWVEALFGSVHVERLLGHPRARVRRKAVDRDAVALQLLRDDDR